LNSSFFASVLAGIERSATEEGYGLIIATSPEKVEKEKANARNLFHKRVDGLIVSLSLGTDNLQHFEPYFAKGIPVFCDRVHEKSDTVKVIIDYYKCGFDVTQHLIEQVCKRISNKTVPCLCVQGL
jgi:LacI family transcriptional regulator